MIALVMIVSLQLFPYFSLKLLKDFLNTLHEDEAPYDWAMDRRVLFFEKDTISQIGENPYFGVIFHLLYECYLC